MGPPPPPPYTDGYISFVIKCTESSLVVEGFFLDDFTSSGHSSVMFLPKASSGNPLNGLINLSSSSSWYSHVDVVALVDVVAHW